MFSDITKALIKKRMCSSENRPAPRSETWWRSRNQVDQSWARIPCKKLKHPAHNHHHHQVTLKLVKLGRLVTVTFLKPIVHEKSWKNIQEYKKARTSFLNVWTKQSIVPLYAPCPPIILDLTCTPKFWFSTKISCMVKTRDRATYWMINTTF